MAFLTAMSNSFGARWFDEKWKPQFDQPEWKDTLDFYVKLMKDAGPQGASSNGFNENLALFQHRQVRHVDRCHGCCFLRDQPEGLHRRRQGRLRAGSGQGPRQARQLAVGLEPRHPGRFAEGEAPRSSSPGQPARTTPTSSPPRKAGLNVPPGTRTSLYANAEYQKAAPFAKMTLDSASMRPTRPSRPSSRCPMSVSSSWRSRNSRASARRSASSSRQLLPASDGRRGAAAGPAADHPRNDQGGYIK
jgi:sorbitol/mannitol transport system substrate-binding protein